MNYLHDELLDQILLKLPVKSIVRFKSVSKPWFSLFKNPRFVSEYDVNVKKKNSHDLLIIQSRDEYLPRDMFLFYNQTLTSYEDLFPLKPPNNLGGITIHDGLFCLLYNNDVDITLWNPATREFRHVPKICHENYIPPMSEIFCRFTGFGSESSSSEYKVIQCYFYYDSINKRAVESESLRHYVYCLSTNSWRELKGKHVEAANVWACFSATKSNACVKGVHYWVGYKLLDYNCILAFHFSTEVYELIDFPKSKRCTMGDLLRLPEDRISLWTPNTDDIGDVWLLNNNDKGQYFWTKLLRINDNFPQIGIMLRFWNNEVFVKIRSGGRVLLCNLETEKLEDMEIKIEEDLHLFGIYTYEESLFPIT